MFARISSLVLALVLASIACAEIPEPATDQQQKATKATTTDATGSAREAPAPAASTTGTPAGTAAPIAATANLPQCCGTRGRCVPDSSIDANLQSNLAACGSPGNKCVPTEFLADQAHKGKACSGNVDLGAMKLPYAGVCLSDCLNVESQNLLSRTGCETGELCVPCTHPVTAAPTGAPGCSGT